MPMSQLPSQDGITDLEAEPAPLLLGTSPRAGRPTPQTRWTHLCAELRQVSVPTLAFDHVPRTSGLFEHTE